MLVSECNLIPILDDRHDNEGVVGITIMTSLEMTARLGRTKALEMRGRVTTARPAKPARPDFVSRRTLGAQQDAKGAYRLLSASIARWIAGVPPSRSRQSAK